MTEERKEPTITTKRIKSEDRISLLPDCLLVEILSRLPDTKYAIRTGTLSKRWQHLWTFVHNLIFISHFRNSASLYEDRPDFFPFVSKTLTQCRRFNINKFEVQLHHGYDIRFESQVRDWIRYAIACNVKELNMQLLDWDLEAEFVLKDDFFFINSSLTHLTLEGCIFNPTGPICWKNLISLDISYGNLDEDSIENILSGCPLLETLKFHHCYGYSRLNITSKSVKNLVFSGYSAPPPDDRLDDLDDIIEINAPNILSLSIRGDLLLWKLLLLNVSSLVNVDLNYTKLGHSETSRKEAEDEMLKGFILRLPHVNQLKIGISCFKAFFHLEASGFKFPSNLKVLDSLQVADWFDWSDCSDSDSVESGDCGDWEALYSLEAEDFFFPSNVMVRGRQAVA